MYKKWNWENNRKLNLNGEAYFKVTKGKTFEVAIARTSEAFERQIEKHKTKLEKTK